MDFKQLDIIDNINQAILEAGYSTPTDIQKQAIPLINDARDVLASAQTGTGKTAAFAIPMLQRFRHKPKGKRKLKGLVVAPTRELAQQIYESYLTYGKYLNVKVGVIYGGVSQKRQERFLANGVDIVIATPGRLIDLIKQRVINLTDVEMFVLDEADRLLDMGFINDIKLIAKEVSQKRQTLLFSATLPKAVLSIAKELMDNPIRLAAQKISSPVAKIEQSLYYVDPDNKKKLLVDLLKQDLNDTVIVFARTKNNTEQIVKHLKKHGISAEAIHGDKSQNKRIKTLNDFKNYKFQVLVATDVASRGLDIDDLSCVINYNIPSEAETYIHRIGRTARAGEAGLAIAFCDYGERKLFADIEALMDTKVAIIEHDYPMVDKSVLPPNSGGQSKKRQSGKIRKRNHKRGSKTRK